MSDTDEITRLRAENERLRAVLHDINMTTRCDKTAVKSRAALGFTPVPNAQPRAGEEGSMTHDITIPPDAVEAAARAICETENGPCKCMPDECGCIYWKAHATAALRALAASSGALIPKENS